MSQDSSPEKSTDDLGNRNGTNRGLIIAVIVLAVVAILIILLALGVFSGDGEELKITPTVEQTGAYINILEPTTGTVLDIKKPIAVMGRGSGLFEGNVVVQAVDESGNVLAEEATIIQSTDAGIGAEGPWQTTLSVRVESGTPGSIRAYSPSPKDGSKMAENFVEVTFGEVTTSEAFIKISDPANESSVDISVPVTVKGEAGGLDEGSLVVQALDLDENILAEKSVTIDSPDAGPWQVDLDVEVASGTTGIIRSFLMTPDGGEVTVSDNVSVTYAKEEAPEEGVKLEEHLWLLMAYQGNPVLEGTMITAEFKSGEVAGTAGCNNYFAPFEISNGNMTVGPTGTTRMACEMPEGVMEQENEYLRLVELSNTYQIVDRKLEISDSSGNVILVYQAAVVGIVTALEGSELPEDAVVTISLLDVSLADVAGTLIGEQVINNPSEWPIPFAVIYNPEDIDQRNTYAVGVRITDSAGNLIYINTSAYNVITHGNPSQIDVMVDPT